jgi:hypothetical protein
MSAKEDCMTTLEGVVYGRASVKFARLHTVEFPSTRRIGDRKTGRGWALSFLAYSLLSAQPGRHLAYTALRSRLWSFLETGLLRNSVSLSATL